MCKLMDHIVIINNRHPESIPIRNDQPSMHDLEDTYEEQGLLYPDASEYLPRSAFHLHSKFIDSPETKKQKIKSPISLREVLTYIAALLVLACTGINISFWRASRSQSPSETLQHIHSYAGLSALSYNVNETYENSLSITNYPHVLTQISSREPNKIWPDDSAKHLIIAFGTVSPDTRRFHVEKGISSIAQFRIVDFGMERCHLELNLSQLKIENSNWSWPTPELSVWSLEAPNTQFIDVRTLSWNSRPHRIKKITSWSLVSGEIFTSDDFDCPWGTRPAFELECESIGCLVDFWSSPLEESPSTSPIS